MDSYIGLTSSETSTKRDVRSATPTLRYLTHVAVLQTKRQALELMVTMFTIFESLALTATNSKQNTGVRFKPKDQKAVPHVGSPNGLTSNQTNTKRDVRSATPTVRSIVRVPVPQIQRKPHNLVVIMSSIFESLTSTTTTQGKTWV